MQKEREKTFWKWRKSDNKEIHAEFTSKNEGNEKLVAGKKKQKSVDDVEADKGEHFEWFVDVTTEEEIIGLWNCIREKIKAICKKRKRRNWKQEIMES